MKIPEIFNTGLNSNAWGNGGWVFLHSITLTYPNDPTENDKKMYKNFFESLGYLLPCNECSNHYNNYIKSNPINSNVLKDKLSLSIWLYNVHNNVNDILNKKQIGFHQFIDEYYQLYTSDFNSTNNIAIYIMIFILLLLILIFILYKYKC
jgi:FAD-linked sulfhydryl oxidase